MKKTKNSIINLAFIVLIFFMIVFVIIFPLSNDDFRHGASGFVFDFMHYLNGRYLGNILGVFMAVNIYIRIFIKIFTLFSIIWIVKRNLKITNNLYLIIFLTLLILMPLKMFRQVMPFNAGFSNYVIPLVGIFIVVFLHLSKKQINSSFLKILFFNLLGICNSLFMENYTIFNLILSFYLFIFQYKKDKKSSKIYFSYLIGSIFGTIIMFTNPNYLMILKGSDSQSYRSLSSFNDILIKPFIIIRDAFLYNYLINIILSTLSVLIYRKKIKQNTFYLKASFVIILVYMFYNISKILKLKILYNYLTLLEIIFVIAFFFSFIYIINKSAILTKKEKYRYLFYIIMGLLILSPLIVVSPLWPRCYFVIYLILSIFIVDFMLVMKKNDIINIERYNNVIILISMLVNVYYLYVYGTIYIKNKERINNINYSLNLNKKEINLESLPYPNFIHGTICSEYDRKVFKRFYDIPSDVIIKVDCKKNN